MKIGVISDLHVDRYNTEEIQEKNFLLELSNEVRRRALDILIIAGDIANDHIAGHRFIQGIEQMTGIKVLFVPGNHDFWNFSGDYKNTWEIYEYFSQQPESLIKKPYIVNDEWAIVGNPAWYDYTFANNRFSYKELEKREFKGGTWQDKVRLDFKMPDKAVSKYFSEVAHKDLEKVKEKNIILVTHVPTNKRFRVPMPHKIFDYYNAFMGTTDFDDFYKKYNIKYSVSGHIHFRYEFTSGGVHYINACLGYRREWKSNDLVKEIRNTMQVIEI